MKITNSNIHLFNEVNKIYIDYKNEFIIQLDKFSKNHLIDTIEIEEIFEKIKNNCKNTLINKNSIINDISAIRDRIFDIMEIKFFCDELDLFITCNNTDHIEKLFMHLNKKLCNILLVNYGYIALEENNQINFISWYNNNNLYYNFYTNMENLNKDSIIKKYLDDNKSVIFCFKEGEVIDNQILDLYIRNSQYLYKKYFDRLMNLDNTDHNGIGNGKNLVDLKIYRSKKKIQILSTSYNKDINILHISDSHLFEKEKTKQSENNFSDEFLSNFKSTTLICNNDNNDIINPQNIDFVVLTGDIINAGSSTRKILNNYLEAFKQLQVIAKEILGNIWKKRILIIPGNHDYGMINELKINFEDRSFKNVEVINVKKEFEKFVFFHLIFDNQKLNDTMYKLENFNNMVENKTYKIGQDKYLTFYLFNTSYKSNSIRSNKISLYVPDNIEYKKNTKYFFLMHHTPLFKINYYRDIFKQKEYELLKFAYGTSNKDYEKIIKNIINNDDNLKIIINDINEKNKEIKLEIGELKNKQEKINIYLNTKKSIEDEDNKKILEILIKNNNIDEKETLLNGIMERNNNLIYALEYEKNSNYEINEINNNKVQSILSYFKMSYLDSEDYKKNFKKISDKFSDFIVLGGHVHFNRYKEKKKYIISEQGKTFINNIFHYSVINYNTNNNKIKIYNSIKLKYNSEKNYYGEADNLLDPNYYLEEE